MSNIYKIGIGHKKDMFFVLKDGLIIKIFYALSKAETYLDEIMSKPSQAPHTPQG